MLLALGELDQLRAFDQVHHFILSFTRYRCSLKRAVFLRLVVGFQRLPQFLLPRLLLGEVGTQPFDFVGHDPTCSVVPSHTNCSSGKCVRQPQQ